MRRALVVVLLLFVTCQSEKRDHAQRGREAALKHDLFEMRKAIDDYRADRGHGPHSLQELQEAHYLRAIPKDPLTGAVDWRETTEQVVVRGDDFAAGSNAPPQTELMDVHSRASGKDAAGKPYSEY